MPNPDPQRVTELRTVIADFLKKRFDDKLDKLAPEDPKRAELQKAFIPNTWLGNAARRVSQIQAVTHSLKPIHPDAKGTNLYCPPRTLPEFTVVGSHCLRESFVIDFVCDAKLLPYVAFFNLQHRGRNLLTLFLSRDADMVAALSDDSVQAGAWANAFGGLIESRGRIASHILAKQLYWPTGDDPHDDASYHLLAPLYASSLTHRVYQTVQDDRFSEEAKGARQARKDGTFCERPVHEYPQLAIQQLGGTNQQNVSHLNSIRHGNNFLLASLPPTWRSVALKPLLNTDSMFSRYGRRPEIRNLVKTLLAFLKSEPIGNAETRARRNELVDSLIDEFLQFSAELRSLPAGWSQTTECRLSTAEKHWLDPNGVSTTYAEVGQPLPTDTTERISAGFANWLNAQLREPLPMGDPEYLTWRKQIHEQIKADEREASDVN